MKNTFIGLILCGLFCSAAFAEERNTYVRKPDDASGWVGTTYAHGDNNMLKNYICYEGQSDDDVDVCFLLWSSLKDYGWVTCIVQIGLEARGKNALQKSMPSFKADDILLAIPFMAIEDEQFDKKGHIFTSLFVGVTPLVRDELAIHGEGNYKALFNAEQLEVTYTLVGSEPTTITLPTKGLLDILRLIMGNCHF